MQTPARADAQDPPPPTVPYLTCHIDRWVNIRCCRSAETGHPRPQGSEIAVCGVRRRDLDWAWTPTGYFAYNHLPTCLYRKYRPIQSSTYTPDVLHNKDKEGNSYDALFACDSHMSHFPSFPLPIPCLMCMCVRRQAGSGAGVFIRGLYACLRPRREREGST